MLLNTAAQNSQLANLLADHATSSLTLHSGSVPASANSAAGTTLVTHTLAGFEEPASGSADANAIADATIATTGTPTHARLSNGTETLQLSVGLSGSGAEVIVSTTSLVSGDTSQVLSVTLSQPT